ncbi:hypothetical protein HGM15179_015409 [Zosterops borbonicus]|uniref:Uncharacterized protein n=1 Tax=Zosterops borbonicus TaxID=364589 RepID=A0A8K1G4Q2_9PASS|nr:hypothetical protein HGM15179_015409 [Zosterops borbonicus]
MDVPATVMELENTFLEANKVLIYQMDSSFHRSPFLDFDTRQVQVHNLWQYSLPLPQSMPLIIFSPELAGNVLMLD